MVRASDPSNLYVGRGSLYFDRFLAGTRTKDGWLHIGNATSIQIIPTVESIKKKSSMTKDSALLKTVGIGTEMQLKITGEEFSKDNLAMMTMGDLSALTQSSGSEVAERITPAGGAEQGKAYQTVFRNISAVVIKVIAATMTEGTDYVIDDAVAGLIRIVEGGGIADGDDVDADYSYAVDTSTTIQAAKEGQIEGSILIVPDPVAGPKLEGEYPIVSFSPDGGFDLIGDEFGSFTLNADVVKDEAGHPTYPFGRIIVRP